MLGTAVLLWQLKIQKNFDYYWSKKDYFAEVIASKGDIILYKSETKGATADAFNNLACAIALLSFSELGVNFLGVYYKFNDSEQKSIQKF